MPSSFVRATSLDGRGPSVGADYVVAGHVKLRAEVLRVGQGDLPVREGAGIGPPRMTCQSPSCEIRRMDASASPNSTPATLRRHAAGSLLGSPPAARHMSVRLSISARSRVARTDASLASGGISMDARITKVADRFFQDPASPSSSSAAPSSIISAPSGLSIFASMRRNSTISCGASKE